jgi:hypothetical protein
MGFRRVLTVRLVLVAISTLALCGFGQVQEAWVARHSGPYGAFALAVDSAGNAYVTGAQNWTGNGMECTTIKYDHSGNEVWAARYVGSGNSAASGDAIAVDAAGNVYVAADTLNSSGTSDYTTIKYDSNGNEVWAVRYNGPADGNDLPYALAVDATGNVYVTGVSAGSGSDYDYATVKYDSDGNEQWVARYNGPGNSWDYATAIAVDSAGNVYVSGTSVGSGTGEDYATVKYAANGAQVWVARYNGPGNASDQVGSASALAVDGAGNVYVTGSSAGSGTGSDYATVKYAANGAQVWVARYNGPANLEDGAYGLALDNANNVYVTGTSDGNGTAKDYATVKYDMDGKELWLARYDGPDSSDDAAFGIALDSGNNVYVSGNSYGVSTGYDYATVKYDGNGNQLWVARFNDSDSLFDDVWAMAVDGAGDVYVTGVSGVNSGKEHFATVKYVQTAIISLSPDSVVAGGSGFTLTVNGFGFQNNATVYWNGAARTTTFVNDGQLTADILASDIASSAQFATAAITVVNPPATTSPSQVITIVSDNVGVVQSATAGLGQSVSVSTAPTEAGQAGVSATLVNAGSATRATITTATFTTNPTAGTIFDVGGGYVDVRLAGGDAGDSVTARFYYPSTITGDTEANLALWYFTGSGWDLVLSSGGNAPEKDTTDDLDGTVSGGRFSVLFDNTSTPAVTDLTGSVFTITLADRTPMAVGKHVLDQLIKLRTTVTDKQDTRKLDKAIEDLKASLASGLWLDPTHLQPQKGDRVFMETQDAVTSLEQLLRSRHSTIDAAVVQGFIERLVQADRVLASVAIDEAEAAGTNPKDILKARTELAWGDVLVQGAMYTPAIEHYENAWRRVTRP